MIYFLEYNMQIDVEYEWQQNLQIQIPKYELSEVNTECVFIYSFLKKFKDVR